MARVDHSPGWCGGGPSIRSIVIIILLIWSGSVTWLLLTTRAQTELASVASDVVQSAAGSTAGMKNYATLPPQKRVAPEASKNLRRIPEAKAAARRATAAVKVKSNLQANKAMAHANEKIAAKQLTTAAACKTSTWGVWSPCTKTCAGGKKQRNRHVMEQARFGECPLPPHSE